MYISECDSRGRLVVFGCTKSGGDLTGADFVGAAQYLYQDK